MELRQALAKGDDLLVLYVLADAQVNAKTRSFIDDLGLRDRVRFLVDPASAAIDALGIRKAKPEAIERGVPHPATYVLDRQGIVRLVDVREDFHVWLDPQVVIDALVAIP